MLTIRIRALARRTMTDLNPRGITSAYKLHQECGGNQAISPTIIQSIWNSDQEASTGYDPITMIGLTTAELICKALTVDPQSPVQVSDWLRYVPDEAAEPTGLSRGERMRRQTAGMKRAEAAKKRAKSTTKKPNGKKRARPKLKLRPAA
jgi:hypothetical protein